MQSEYLLEKKIAGVFTDLGWDVGQETVFRGSGNKGWVFDITLYTEGKMVGAVETKLYTHTDKTTLDRISARIGRIVEETGLVFYMLFIGDKSYVYTKMGFHPVEQIPTPRNYRDFSSLKIACSEELYQAFMALIVELDIVKNPNKSDYVFISYKREEKSAALAMSDFLRRNGYGCWIDVDCIVPGEHYPDPLYDAISGSLALVFMLSRSSLGSTECMREIDIAINGQKVVIPLKIDAELSIDGVPAKVKDFQFADDYQGVLKGLERIRMEKLNRRT